MLSLVEEHKKHALSGSGSLPWSFLLGLGNIRYQIHQIRVDYLANQDKLYCLFLAVRGYLLVTLKLVDFLP